MAIKRGHYGSGTISPSGKGSWRIRYRIGAQRFSKTVEGSRTEAAKELRNQLKAGDDGAHVAPSRMTFKEWSERWIELKARSTTTQSAERYANALNTHAVPALGKKPLQRITATDLDTLFGDLAHDLAPRTAGFVFMTLKSCLSTAVKKGLLTVNPANKAERPATVDEDAAMVLDEEQVAGLVQGFRGTFIYSIVAVGAFTGMRRNEILALRWVDVDLAARTISVTRSIERTKQHGVRIKGPKTARGRRTIKIDEGLVSLLRAEKDKHLRLVAGVNYDTDVNLSLIKLPDGALVFPAFKAGSLTALQCAESITFAFVRQAAKLGFPGMRFHDLRASHGTALLDRGVGVHTVAERLGHDPALLLRIYAKRTKKSDTAAADIIGTMTKGVL